MVFLSYHSIFLKGKIMIEKNEFLMYNEIIYSLNKCHELTDLKSQFFSIQLCEHTAV